ncbi:MAG: D-sedoheptulose-7-phosphate isomerase [Pseudonocardia sp.]
MIADLTAADTAEVFARRSAPTDALATDAQTVARACHAMAQRFHRGGRLLAFGAGSAAADAAHVVVEFVHPVIMGKRALPAVNLAGDPAAMSALTERHGTDESFAAQVYLQGQPADIALGFSVDGRNAAVHRGLEQARDTGLLTVALLGGHGGKIAEMPGLDHAITVHSDDPLVVREMHVTAYHVLWELVHVFLDHPGVLT